MAAKVRSKKKKKMPFRFVDLPPELRLRVYEELVVVGKVFYTPDAFDIEEGERFTRYGEYRKPALQILRTSKQVHREAEDIYLTKNLFVLPHLWYRSIPIHPCDTGVPKIGWRQLFSMRALTRIKHVSIALCGRTETSLCVTRSMWNDMEDEDPGFFDRATENERHALAHEIALERLEEHRLDLWYRLQRFASLESLEIDVSNAYCPLGCCRKLEVGWSTLIDMELKNTRVIGMWSKAESASMLHGGGDFTGLSEEEIEEKIGVEFNPEKDPWELGHLRLKA